MWAGTFLANQLGCALDYMFAILGVRLGGLDLTQEAALSAASTGFSGSLTTVSTWAVEVGGLSSCKLLRGLQQPDCGVHLGCGGGSCALRVHGSAAPAMLPTHPPSVRRVRSLVLG